MPKTSKTRLAKEAKLKKALKECWYLDKQKKQYWLDSISTIPDIVLDNVLNDITGSNKIVEKSLRTAIKANPKNNFLASIKSQIKKIKLHAFEIEEDESKSHLDQDLEDQLKDNNL